MSTTFNMFDLIFVVSSFIFILVAFLRGFVKELFALFNWIITITLSYLLTPFVARFVEHYSHNKLVVNVASTSMVFVIIFIAIALATRGLSHDWKEKMPENLDRFLGVVYGVFKSLLIFGLIYAIILNFCATLEGSKKKKPESGEVPAWMTQAKCFGLIKFSGDLVRPLVDGAIDNMTHNLMDEIKPKKQNLDEKIDEIVDENGEEKKGVEEAVGGSAGALSDNLEQKSSGKKNEDKGYSKKEIEKMNRLIEIVN